MLKVYSLVITIILACSVQAQQRLVHGLLKDSLTQLPIQGGVITNSNTQKSIHTEANGYFQIIASPGDVLLAVAPNFKHDTLRYPEVSRDTITITLAPTGNILEPVTVEASYAQYQQDSARRRKEFEADRGHVYSTIDKTPHQGFGLVLNLDPMFKKKYKNKKRDENNFESMEEEIYIHFRYPPQLVALYTGYRGETLSRFMQFSQPSYRWLREHPSREQLVYYISDKVKEFRTKG